MEKNTRITIIGYGFVGTATEYFLINGFKETFDIQILDPAKGYNDIEWKGVEYAFICVPTNLKGDKLDASIIDNILEDLDPNVHPIIRSTVGPEQALNLARKGCIMMPEFLRERHWKEDVMNPNIDLIVGAWWNDNFVDLMSNNTIGKMVKHVTPMEASMMKMMRNAALAVKVGLANEFNDICKSMDIDYKVLQEFLESDENLGGSHWAVPGPDEKVGFGGTCLPKDLTHASALSYNTHNIMNTALEANKDRRNNE
jgi:UDP-glucose 6-dehydrogenase